MESGQQPETPDPSAASSARSGSPASSARSARAALEGVRAARGLVADRVRSPWWYHPALGISFAFAFATVSISWGLIPYGVIIGLSLVPTVLTLAVKRTTGVAIDRYMATPGARRESYVYSLLFVLLIAAGLALEWAADLRWSMAGCGVLVLVLTVVMGRRIEEALALDLRAGR